MSTILPPLKYQPVTSFGNQPYDNLFNSDFSVGKINMKVKAKTGKNKDGLFSVKQGRLINDIADLDDQKVSIEFPWDKSLIQFVASKQMAKLHFDLQDIIKQQYMVFGKEPIIISNHFGGIEMKGSNSYALRLGISELIYSVKEIAAFEFVKKDNENSFYYSVRDEYSSNNIFAVVSNKFDIRRFKWLKYDFLLAYRNKNYDFTLRHYSSEEPSLILIPKINFGIGKVIANAIYTHGKHALGTQIEFDGKCIRHPTFSEQNAMCFIGSIYQIQPYHVQSQTAILTQGQRTQFIRKSFAYVFASQFGARNRAEKGFLGFTLKTNL